MYLYGSLASGDFDPASSDVDVVVVTDGKLTEKTIWKLRDLHDRIMVSGMPLASELDGAYIDQEALRCYEFETAVHPHFERGERLLVEQFHSDWVIQRYVLREMGVVVAGPDPRPMIDPISCDDLRRAVLDLLWWWEEQLIDPSLLSQGGYQAYAILSMCRILYTMQFGAIVSKPIAGQWAIANLGARWKPLIERAFQWVPGFDVDRLDETQDFIRYTLERCQSSRGDDIT
jgi:hypothetical protein